MPGIQQKMTKQSRTQNEIAEDQNKEQMIVTDSQLIKILVFSSTEFKITMMNILKKIGQNGKYQEKTHFGILLKYNFRTKNI